MISQACVNRFWGEHKKNLKIMSSQGRQDKMTEDVSSTYLFLEGQGGGALVCNVEKLP